MTTPLLLDNNILGSILRPDIEVNKPVAVAVLRLQEDPRFRVYVPEIRRDLGPDTLSGPTARLRR